MPPFFIRSTIFNLCFYLLTAISCIALLPTLFLPRNVFLFVVRGFVYTTAFLEKYILGLTYEVRGKENLPKGGAYIVAAKHQSAYETFKLHILFNDPAIVLKKELLKIPLWGKYLAKSDVIAIDRSSSKTAIKSITEGALRIAKQERQIIIFPQGTRVAPDILAKDKRYKIGIVRMQKAAELPIIPMALNTGVFYPKNSWCKKAGKVVFEFLPPINNSNDDISTVIRQIEMTLEEKTAKLVEEGKQSIPTRSKAKKTIYIILLIIAISYTANWFIAASIAKRAVVDYISDLSKNEAFTNTQIPEPDIYGFPFKLTMSMNDISLKTAKESISISFIKAQSLPMLGMPIDIRMKNISISMDHWKQSLDLDSINTQVIFKNDILYIEYGKANKGNTQAQARGDIDFASSPYPIFDLEIKLINTISLIENMAKNNIINAKASNMVSNILKSLEKDGVITTKLTSQKNKLYLGPIKILELPLDTVS